jgi:hypothetical protein
LAHYCSRSLTLGHGGHALDISGFASGCYVIAVETKELGSLAGGFVK